MVDFEKYDRENPQIWSAFVTMTMRTKNKGFSNYSAKGIIELIRWHTGAKGNDQFKVNNNYAPDYARKFENEYPEFKGFFRMRVLKQGRVKSEENERS